MKQKKILIINDRSTIKGGADAVALMQANEFKKCGSSVILFTTHPNLVPPYNIDSINSILPQYEMTFINFIRNLFWVKAYVKLKRLVKKNKPDLVIVHSWTKQLSSSIFFALRKNPPFLVAHDYFLICPNGGLYNYHAKQKCSLKGGSLNCLLTQCDKANYSHKIFRWLRFWLQSLGVAISHPKIIALNELQVLLIGKANIAGIAKNKIEEPFEHLINANVEKKYVTYIGRGDPEKGVDIFSHKDFFSKLPLMLIGPEKGIIKSNTVKIIDCGWVEESDMNSLLGESLVGIFPSLWHEVDPLVPWKFLARGVPVVSSIDNVFGQYLKNYLPELVYENVYELNKILERVIDKLFYDEVRRRSLEFYRNELILRANMWKRVWHESIN
jgi:glycosyltransferase involved in cell wall biosynthesis